jgi:hypothetical protein
MQLDGGSDNVRTITLSYANGASLATIYIVNTTLGSFEPGWEYWYVNRTQLSNLGAVGGLSVSVSDSNTTSPPSDPGYSPEQKFKQAQSPSGGWGSGWTTDPFGGAGYLYAGPTGADYLRLITSGGSPPAVNWVIWYQVLSSGSPSNFNPNGSWSTSSGSVPVPTGSLGYYIAQSTD